MNPKPFFVSNHFTLPDAIAYSSPHCSFCLGCEATVPSASVRPVALPKTSRESIWKPARLSIAIFTGAHGQPDQQNTGGPGITIYGDFVPNRHGDWHLAC